MSLEIATTTTATPNFKLNLFIKFYRQKKLQKGFQVFQYVYSVSAHKKLNYRLQEKNFSHSSFSLQEEIQSKLKAIYNVIEMLSGIIRDGKSTSDLEDQISDDSSHKRNRKSHSIETLDMNKKYNYIHYDPELHWCRTCDVFPKTAKDLLLHLQSQEHKKIAQDRDIKDDTPWHHLPAEPELPYFEGAPKKRLPIKGNYLKFIDMTNLFQVNLWRVYYGILVIVCFSNVCFCEDSVLVFEVYCWFRNATQYLVN